MLPRLALDGIKDRDGRNAVLTGEGVVCLTTGSISGSNRLHFLGGQARAVDSLTLHHTVRTGFRSVFVTASDTIRYALRIVQIAARHPVTSLGNAILDVLAVSANEEMRGIAARRVVASVTGESFTGIDTPCEEQGEAGRRVLLPSVMSAAIPIWRPTTDPRPTSVRTSAAINAIPEVLNLRFGQFRHGEDSLHCPLHFTRITSGEMPGFFRTFYHFGG